MKQSDDEWKHGNTCTSSFVESNFALRFKSDVTCLVREQCHYIMNVMPAVLDDDYFSVLSKIYKAAL